MATVAIFTFEDEQNAHSWDEACRRLGEILGLIMN
jgi:hypothetical protein